MRLRLAIGLTLGILVIEVAGGLMAHSLALLSDAGHVVTDVFALGLAWFALEQAKRPADMRRSYGYQRAGILAALLNATVLIVIVLAVAFEAARRLFAPQPVAGGLVIAVAVVAIAVNVYILLMLRNHAGNLSLRAAVLHVAGDLAASAAVIVSGVVIVATGWLYADPLLSLAIAALIAWGAWRIVREAVNMLMEGTPRDVDLEAITAEVTKTRHVTGIHDLHVWGLSSDSTALSMHVVIDDVSLGDAEHVVRDLEGRLCERFAIGHTTIQVESCHPCGEIHHGAGEHNHPHSHVVISSSRPASLPAEESAGPPQSPTRRSSPSRGS